MPTHQELPEQFGRYRILDKLGAGGMGAVYLAEDTKLGRKVALKVPHFKSGDGTAILERFRRETRLAAGIDHPNFCQVHDVDEVEGIHFFTMPFVEGRPLSDCISPEQPWVPRQGVELVRLIAQVVGLLHAKGIVHRDLKPSNIMLRSSGEPVLMDFGLACSLKSESTRLTGTGEVLGTLAYMPPEQLEGDRARLGPTADVYSLGMILYELLTGQLPFRGSPLVVVAQVGSKAPEPPSTLQPGLDARLDAICRKALAKKPEERFADTSTFVAALEEFLGMPVEQRLNCTHCGKPVKVPPSSAGKRMKCPRCGVSLATAATTTMTPPRSRSVPDGRETVPPRGQETATPPRRPPWPAGRRVSLVLLTLMGLVMGLVLATAFGFWSRRDEDMPDTMPPDKDVIQKPAELRDKFENTVTMQMVRIKSGTFKMGSPEDDKDKDSDEVAQHLVKIKNDFYLGATEVTVGQFKQFVKEDSYKTEAEKAGNSDTWQTNEYSKADNQPVAYVSWKDAVAFCQWLRKKEGKYYDLPTEAEWEYACRAGGKPKDAYCFGNDRDKLGEYAWFGGNAGNKTHPVGTKKANAWGLYDMHGNVWEWCKDGDRTYPDKATAEKQKDPIEDPIGSLDEGRRFLRGGSWVNIPRSCRSAHRFDNASGTRDKDIGFRVVLRLAPRAP